MTLACSLCHGQPNPNVFSLPTTSSQPMAYAVTLNEADMGQWILIRQDGNWYATEEATKAWRIKTDNSTPHLVRHEQRWFALQHLPGYRASEDPMNQSLTFWLAPTAFEGTHLGAQASAEAPAQPVEPALYLNLDVNYARIQTRQTRVTQELAAYTELGLSNSLGVITSTQIVRQPMGGPALSQDLRGWTRLETTLTRHDPGQHRTLRVGDATTRTGLTGRSVYFGGIQWGTDHGMTPNFSASPRPVITGMAPTPGTVELFVNDVLRQTSAVPSGPFSLDTPPLYSTDGQLRVVVRDLLGRETVITQPFFQHASQLEEGLSDWSVAIERRQLTLAPGARYRYRIEVSAPAEAPPQECRFALMVEGQDPAKVRNDISFPVGGRIAVIVYVAVGDAAPRLELVATHWENSPEGPRPVLEVRNTGQAHTRLDGLLNGTDNTGAISDWVPADTPILPGETRKITVRRVTNGDTATTSIRPVQPPLTLRGSLEWDDKRLPIDVTLPP